MIIKRLIESDLWYLIKTEIPQVMSNWRIVPRGLMVAYGIAFYQTATWFMNLDAPNNAQAAFVSVIVGAGAAWFGIYVNGKPSQISDKKKEDKPISEQIG